MKKLLTHFLSIFTIFVFGGCSENESSQEQKNNPLPETSSIPVGGSSDIPSEVIACYCYIDTTFQRYWADSYYPAPYPYNFYAGKRDDTFWTLTDYYGTLREWTTLGLLARRSDIIGVGLTSNCEDKHFTVTVDLPLVGCTNNQSIVVYANTDLFSEGVGSPFSFMPTNDCRIVFAVYTNDYQRGGMMYWSSPEYPETPYEIRPRVELRFLNRSWWPVERDDGVLFMQFTNVLQTVRFERNWTNYFYLCRDGLYSASTRVREDSHWDLRRLAKFSTDTQRRFILKDPRVLRNHKTLLLTESWRGRPDY